MLNKNKGFTLLELITVITIISILATVSYASYKNYYERARAYSAKKDLSAIVAIAETFQSNTGFFLPNLRAMHIPIKGRYSYNYKVICHTNGTSGNVLWETDAIDTDTCGGFDLQTTPDPSDPSKETLDAAGSCGSGTTLCWMGAVLCNHYSSGDSISCGTGTDYTLGLADRGVLQWKSANDEDWNGSDVKKKELAPLFNIVDFAAKKEGSGSPPNNLSGLPYCKRVSRNDDLLKDSSACLFMKEFAVNSSDVKAIIERNWVGEEEDFISNPSKLVVTALACKQRQSDCVGTNFDYSIIRMDTNRMVKIVQ